MTVKTLYSNYVISCITEIEDLHDCILRPVTKQICSVSDRNLSVSVVSVFKDLVCDWLKHNKHSRHILGV